MRFALRLISRQSCQVTRPQLVRPFTSAPALRLKEDRAHSAQEIDAAKKEQLKTGKKQEELESHSESGIKADQEKVHDHDEHMEDLQKETAQQKQKEHPEGK